MKPSISVQYFQNGVVDSLDMPSCSPSPRAAAHNARGYIREYTADCPDDAGGIAAVITSRPFPSARPTNRIVVC